MLQRRLLEARLAEKLDGRTPLDKVAAVLARRGEDRVVLCLVCGRDAPRARQREPREREGGAKRRRELLAGRREARLG